MSSGVEFWYVRAVPNIWILPTFPTISYKSLWCNFVLPSVTLNFNHPWPSDEVLFFLQIDCSQFPCKLLLTTQNLLYWINPTLCHKHITVQTFVQQCWHDSKFWYSHSPLDSGNNSQIHTGPNCTTKKLFESSLLRPDYPPFCPTQMPRSYTTLHSNSGPNTAAVQTTIVTLA